MRFVRRYAQAQPEGCRQAHRAVMLYKSGICRELASSLTPSSCATICTYWNIRSSAAGTCTFWHVSFQTYMYACKFM